MLDAANEATSSLDVTLLYASTVRPFDAATLRGAVTGSDVILVEPVLEGTSAAEVSAALNKRPHRLLSIGVPNAEHRKYGSLKSHNRALGLDAEGLRARITAWL
jgi:transketolase